jgi:hypothetical protein
MLISIILLKRDDMVEEWRKVFRKELHGCCQILNFMITTSRQLQWA